MESNDAPAPHAIPAIAAFSALHSGLRQRFITILIGLTLAGVGLWAFGQLKIEAYPDISDTQVVVITQYAGRAAEEVEQQVTVPIERALNSAPNVIARRSRTIFGLSVVELTFDYGTNDYFARQVVLEKLRDADLPDGVTSSLGPLSTPIGELYRYTLSGGGLDAMKLRELQDWVVEPRFLQAPGVADVTPFGGLIKQYQIQIDPMALSKYGLSIAQIAGSVQANNSNAGGAMLDNKQQSNGDSRRRSDSEPSGHREHCRNGIKWRAGVCQGRGAREHRRRAANGHLWPREQYGRSGGDRTHEARRESL